MRKMSAELEKSKKLSLQVEDLGAQLKQRTEELRLREGGIARLNQLREQLQFRDDEILELKAQLDSGVYISISMALL